MASNTYMNEMVSKNSFRTPLSDDEQKAIIMNIQDIFALEEDEPRDESLEDDDEEEEVVDLEDRRKRTERLVGVLDAVSQLWWSGSEYVDLVTERLADGSRDPKWRIPLGDSGILNFFIDILNTMVGSSGAFLSPTLTAKHTLKIHILRLIGNSCADTDENRARVVAANCLPSIIMQLADTSLLAFAIPVLFNVCVDYEPAQQQASTSYLSKELIELVASPRFNDSRAFLSYVCKILDLLIQQPSEPDIAPPNTPIVLLRFASSRHNPTDMDDFIALVQTSVAYLSHERLQRAFVEQNGLEAAVAVMVDSYTRFDCLPPVASSPSSSTSDQDSAKFLSQMRSSVNQVLSDISALPEFKAAYPVLSPTASSLRRWISSPQLQLQTCACIMLGNLARSDEACQAFVHTSQIHKPLVAAIRDTTDSQLLHAALGFVKNLALPLANKEEIGGSGIFDILPRLWAPDSPQQIQLSSISLARILIIGTWDNVRRLCRSLSTDKDSPAHMRSNLSILIALFERTEVEPIRMEIARLMTGVCRVFNTYKGSTPEQMDFARRKFFIMHPDIGRPLGFMVSQTKWPVVRSEGWFVFALMAKFPDGAQCISDLMQDVNVFQPLVELLSGKPIIDYKPATPSSPSSSSPEASTPRSTIEPQTPESIQQLLPDAQAAEMARVDRENALVLVSELLRNRGDEMAFMRRSLFEDLLRGGAEVVASYKTLTEDKGQPGTVYRVGLGIQEVIAQSTFELV